MPWQTVPVDSFGPNPWDSIQVAKSIAVSDQGLRTGPALEARREEVLEDRMTKLLDKAIAQARALPPEDQDALAAVLLSMTDEGAGIAPLDDETRAAIREGLEQARRGEFVPEAEIKALWNRYGL
jgi:predicted transcriptional regulator